MNKDTTYKEKFATLKNWLPAIIDAVKKDLKNEHLKNDFPFYRKYFGSKNINKLTLEEMVEAYSQALVQEESAEQLGEFLSHRWLMKNSDVYHFFEEQLSRINPNFSEIVELDEKSSSEIVETAIQQFGAPKTYLFSLMNSVVFPQKIFVQLSLRAEQDAQKQEEDLKAAHKQQSLDTMRSTYEEQIARLTDKYEKKLLGLQKMYTQDVDALKKQIASLQRKING
jgi:hypothetical protein